MQNGTLSHAIGNRRSVRAYADRAISIDHVEKLIWAAQGQTSADGKRAVPSAHALYPLRFFVAAGDVEGLVPGVYAVSADTGQLELRSENDVRSSLRDASVDRQDWVGCAPLSITICADFIEPCRAFADQKPYGSRGQMYVAIEAGAAAQNILLQATSLGLGAVMVAGIDDDKTASVLGLTSPLSPVLHICIGWPAE